MGENVKSLKKENDKLRDQVKSLSEDFQKFKDKMAAKVFERCLADCPLIPKALQMNDGQI